MQQTLKFAQPAMCWEEAMPIGNGSFGAMIFGGENGKIYDIDIQNKYSNKYEIIIGES